MASSPQRNGELGGVKVPFHALTNLKGLALAVLPQIFPQLEILQVRSKTRSTNRVLDVLVSVGR
jgi:hypothetical protein